MCLGMGLLRCPEISAFGFLDEAVDWEDGDAIGFLVNVANVPEAISQEQLLGVIRRSLEPWSAIETAHLPFRIGMVINDPDKTSPKQDGVNVIFWRNTDVPRGDMFAGKAYPFASECDILLAPQAPFTLLDVQATLIHELGHCMGLAHSTAPGIMTKFQGLPNLGYDDRVAVSIRYPNPSAPLEDSTAAVKGRVVRRNGDALLGAVLKAVDVRTNRIIVSGFSGLVDAQRRKDPSGRFELPGLPPGQYRLMIQPMDAFAAADPEGYGSPAKPPPQPFGQLMVDLPELEAGDAYDVGKLTVEE
jgi:hypothetical protein